MQKLTYTNSAGDTAVFAIGAPYVMGHFDGAGELDAEVFTVSGIGIDGAIDVGAVLEPRELTIEGTLYSKEDRADMYGLRIALGKAMNPKHSGILVYENDAGRWRILARPRRLPVCGVRRKEHIPFVAYFTCAKPFWEDVNPTVVRLGDRVGGLRLPFRLPFRLAQSYGTRDIENTGHVSTPIYVEFLGKAAAPSLTNLTTGEKIKIERPLAEGDRLVINTEIRENFATIYRADGTEEDATSWMSFDSSFFQLEPGINRLTYSTDEDSARNYISVTFRNRFVGV